MNQHTPIPWEILGGDVFGMGGVQKVMAVGYDEEIGIITHVDDEIAKSNADFIVRAVNSHEVLLSAMRSIQEHLQFAFKNIDGDKVTPNTRIFMADALSIASKIIAQAEGE